MPAWLKRKTCYVTSRETGEPVATSRTITLPDGRVETMIARDLIDIKLDEKRSKACEFAQYPTSGNIFLRTASEMRLKATSLAAELGLRTRTLPASPTTAVAKARALADELGTRTAPDECTCECSACKDENCEGCDCGAGCDGESCDSETCRCADHRSAITATVGRTLYPIDRAALQQQRELDERIYEARLKRKLAASR
jgi:hypothetical protein